MNPSSKFSNKIVPLNGSVFGLHIWGRLPSDFQAHLWPLKTEQQEQKYSLEVNYQIIDSFPQQQEFWVGTNNDTRTHSRFSLFEQPNGFGLRIECQGCGLFRITAHRIEIEWLPGGTNAAHYFFTYALPLWQEFVGIPVLHASAVVFKDCAVAFVGNSGAGKSTLCAGLVGLGHKFISDDTLPLNENEQGDWHCQNGPPLFRLWPSSLEQQLNLAPDQLPKVHQGLEKRILLLTNDSNSHKENNHKFSNIYILKRQPTCKTNVIITACSASESLIRLIEYSLASAPVIALGLNQKRLKKLARFVNQTRVKYLSYPSGNIHLQNISKAITEDIDNDVEIEMSMGHI